MQVDGFADSISMNAYVKPAPGQYIRKTLVENRGLLEGIPLSFLAASQLRHAGSLPMTRRSGLETK
ncbi:hypothetical protein [Paenibacillus popilliae]|uniref:hypothetical protein n=1 Tax=Paenibacillus popilliae TaxID=78057 RepID=UPI0002D2C123|nr:hypothetical protein [Paenibacillus popilliae]